MKNNDKAQYYFHQGTNFHAQKYLGVHKEDGNYVFRVWAPNAEKVFVCGDFNGWDDSAPMKIITEGGIYEYVDEKCLVKEGDKYKYKIIKRGRDYMKGDPYAVCAENEEQHASIVSTDNVYEWKDRGWMSYRTNKRADIYSSPINVYELHAGSFMRDADGRIVPLCVLADELASYLKQMSYTHVELLPIMSHPYEASWGYQICYYFAPEARYATANELKHFIDTMHNAGIGVILDWVPAHFPKDAHGLYEFDGVPLYEYQGKDRIEHEIWGTRRFDVGRNEVQSFLISNAVYWLEEYHVDGLRVDAVASMLYLDYDKRPGEWIPNEYGDNRCIEAIEFFKKLNVSVKKLVPDALMIAEESTAWANITKSGDNGLGFDMKWNMGWMNDSLSYVMKDPVYRKYHHNSITFSMTYAFSERYILPISHDEVVHGKRSLLDKMNGDYWQKFATSRLYMAYMMTHPGKKLSFMGSEIGMFREWDHNSSVEWFLLDYDMHARYQKYISVLNDVYLKYPPLWEIDGSWDGFKWIDADNAEQSVFSYIRRSRNGEEIIVLLNFTPVVREGYTVSVKENGVYREILNSDSVLFGGSGVVNKNKLSTFVSVGSSYSIKVTLPPLGAVLLARAL